MTRMMPLNAERKTTHEWLQLLRETALASLTVEQLKDLSDWLEAEETAMESGDYAIPSYTDSDAGAAHGAGIIRGAVTDERERRAR